MIERADIEQALKKARRILGVLEEQAAGYSSLTIPAHLKVELGDKREEVAKLEQQLSGSGKRFPRIQGLTLLGEKIAQGAFREYLSSEKLPYYSRSAHLSIDPAPENVAIPDEVALLQRLDSRDLTGLIITGSGGFGKTRLMLEIGRLALADNWLVFRVRERLKADGIYQLAEAIEVSQKVLLLIDYVETQQDFAELLETMNELNEDEDFQFKYIANCRTTHYPSIRDIYKHQQVDLSPDKALDWFKSYRRETVRHILQGSGLGATDDYLLLCRDTPILAVFLAYLHSRERNADLASLVGEPSFGEWLIKRIRLSFQTPQIEKKLAFLITQFPLNDAVAETIYRGDYHQLFSRLANDGWIEQEELSMDLSDDRTWVTIHDVLADQILTHYLESNSKTTELFVCELLEFAVQVGSLRSTLYTLQRLIGLPQLNRLDWLKILNQQMLRAPLAWKETRDVLIRNSLLSSIQTLSLLDRHEPVWEGIETEVDFQNSLAWNIRQYLSEAGSQTDNSISITLTKWIEKSIPQISRTNLLLNWGLKLCPKIVQEAALNWITIYPRKFQTHYLLVAWLESDLPSEAISFAVQQWCDQFPIDDHLSFVYKSWLDAGGDKERIQSHLSAWLSDHATALETSFVYKSWLDAGGDKERIQSHLSAWLSSHATALEANFVYQSWLDAGGDKERIQSHLFEWLSLHATALEAQFVYYSWLDAGGDKERIQFHLSTWLSDHATALEANFVCKSWLDAGGDKEQIQSHLSTWLSVHATALETSFVYKAWLDVGGDKERIQSHFFEWLSLHATVLEADFVYKSWLNAGGDFQLIRSPLIQWLEQNQDFSEIDYICNAWLRAGGEFEIVREAAINWFNRNWQNEKATFLMQSLLMQRSLPLETLTCVLKWCQKFPGNQNCLIRFNHLGSRLFQDELAEDVYLAAEAILTLLLDRRDLHERVQAQIYRALSFIVGARSLQTESFQDKVDNLFIRWLKNPISFGDSIAHIKIQRLSYFQIFSNLIIREKLNIEKDRDCLERFLKWINLWESNNKESIRKSLDYLKYNYPNPNLWQIVQFESES
ncbi:ATP-binding protein [Pseudanabaena sp. BC1403]|uniref:ATP-binding protein n=1 Tax=Pseudanabaena sp. BC1403 TaxID=2043171 RepID=UPI0011AEE242|nr:ATP-binding protein [Pseudanabaena sp. BC1403]